MSSFIRTRTFPLTLSAAFAVLGFATLARAADPSATECIAANDKAITLRDQHQLIETRAAFLTCASASCPAEVRDECAGRVADVNNSLPTIVFEAKDGAGNDLAAVTVTMDGHPFVGTLQGDAVPVDPGTHTFVFETAGQSQQTQQLLIFEGAKGRHVLITFGGGKDLPADVGASSTHGSGTAQKILGWTGVGLGAVGIVMGAVFESAKSSKVSERDKICPGGNCSPGDLATDQARSSQLTDDARTDATLAVVGFVAGGVLAAGGLILVFTAPSGESRTAFSPLLGPGLGGLLVRHSF
ncbi:MAG TPA: hypothetical protein VH142_16595 [Polyangiaceae bacterium]|jgi:hypothetical protein|nr:hypothetical protein [Polyangiaceae bacterium]